MKKAVPLEVYIALNHTKEAQDLLLANGMKPARDHKELVRKLNDFIVSKKEDALKQLVQIHPDKDLILTYATKTEKNSGACGCSGADGNEKGCGCGCGGKNTSALTGEEAKEKMVKVWDSVKPYAPVVIGGGLLLAGLIILVKRA